MTDMRKCIGSAKFGIEAHEAPPADFPAQPSQKDGLGRMCKPHWTEYTRALRMAANAGKTATARKEAAEPTVQSQAAAKVAKRAARVADAEAIAVLREQLRAAAKAAKKPEPIRTRPARGRKTEGEQIVEAVEAEVVQEAANVAEASIA